MWKIDLSYLQREMATKGIINCQREGGRRKKFSQSVKNYSLLLQKNVPSIVGLPLSKTEEQGTNYYIQTNVQYDIFIVLFLICLQNKRRALLSHLKLTYEIYTCPKMQNTAARAKVLKSLRNYYV